MTSENTDHETWIYHALHEAKIVKASEANKLYKQGWRDSPDPKVIFKGIRGKWYKLILWFRSFKEKESRHWNSYHMVIAIIMVLGLVIAFTTLINQSENTSNKNQKKSEVIGNEVTHSENQP